MKIIIYIVTCMWIVFGLFGCSSRDECLEYSKYTCKQLEQATYNVLFYFPKSDKEYYLGTATGISECGNIAYGYADEKHFANNSKWDYLYCLKTKDSECEEKHR